VSDELAFLRDVTAGLEVWFPSELSPHGARLMRTLGVRVHVDPFAIRAGGCS
jgi:hypothetical protein